MGASTETDNGTVLPFSAISGNSIEILPFSAVLPPVKPEIWAAASLAAAHAGSPRPMKVSAAPVAPSAKASRRDSCRIEVSSGNRLGADPGPVQPEHSGGQRLVQIIFTIKNVRTRTSLRYSARRRFYVVAEAFALVSFFSHVTE